MSTDNLNEEWLVLWEGVDHYQPGFREFTSPQEATGFVQGLIDADDEGIAYLIHRWTNPANGERGHVLRRYNLGDERTLL